MTYCSTCIKINPIPTCVEIWLIGYVDPSLNGQLLGYRITNTATGSVITGETEEVEVDGLVIITLPEQLLELMKHYYKLELLDNDNNPVTVTIDDSENCCIEFTTYPHAQEFITFSTITCDVV